MVPTVTDDAALVRRVADWLQQHYAERITAKQIGAAVNRHPGYLGTIFHRALGVSLHEYVRLLRMERAADLIRSGDKIESISLRVGYRSKTTFYRHFRKHFGMTPIAYRDRQPGRARS